MSKISKATLYDRLFTQSPPYAVTLLIGFLAFAGSVALERFMEAKDARASAIVELKQASGQFVALAGEYTINLINRQGPDADVRSDLLQNILRQLDLTKELEEELDRNDRALAGNYIDELKKRKSF